MTEEGPGRRRAIRLQKYLSQCGVASRRHGERLIQQGRVSIDGVVVTELGSRVVPGEQVVRLDGDQVDIRPPRWIAVNKPAGYLTTRSDDFERPTVYSLLPEDAGSLFHVGRLDRLTEGLLVFTNDGETAHRLMHPSYQVARRYRIEVEGEPGAEEIRRLEGGVTLEDGVARAEDVRAHVLGGSPGAGRVVSELHLTLREGRKREVRRMMAALDLPVKRLVRVSFGPVGLGSLALGKWRELTAGEVQGLRAAVGLRGSNGDT
jgi:23S rRNA pseudouridine2605 synthase